MYRLFQGRYVAWLFMWSSNEYGTGAGDCTSSAAAPESHGCEKNNCWFTAFNPFTVLSLISHLLLWPFSPFGLVLSQQPWAPEFTTSVRLSSLTHMRVLENPCVFQSWSLKWVSSFLVNGRYTSPGGRAWHFCHMPPPPPSIPDKGVF